MLDDGDDAVCSWGAAEGEQLYGSSTSYPKTVLYRAKRDAITETSISSWGLVSLAGPLLHCSPKRLPRE